MIVKMPVMEKIRMEAKRHGHNEFGGWLLNNGDSIEDIVFDIRKADGSYVELDCKKLLKLQDGKRDMVHGWFHRHPINTLSFRDIQTVISLTKFWGRCYTLVLLGNGNLLMIKTVKRRQFNTMQPVITETYRKEMPLWGDTKTRLA